MAGRDTYAAREIHIHQASPSATGDSQSAPPSPATASPARIWGGVPARNPSFTGREALLARVRAALVSDGPVAVEALRGMGGVGKTQLAIEYAHRHAAEYDVVWWLNAENSTLLGEQFAALAAELGCADPAAPLEVVQRVVLGELYQRSRWLLVFDNAEQPDDVRAWLPGGAGHVLITTRSYGWDEVAVPVEVDVMDRAESAAILRNRVSWLSEQDADSVAAAVGDLPLAIAQAAAYLAETRMPPPQYIALLQTRAADLLNEGKPPSYPATLAAVTRLAYDRLRGEDKDAAAIAAICAFLAPEPVPIAWFTQAVAKLPEPLGDHLTDPLTRSHLLTRLTRSSLARLDSNGLVMHRLTQAILRATGSSDQAAVRSLAEMTIVANDPGDPDLPANWPAWAQALPHLLATDPAASDTPDLRNVAGRAAWYLIRRGDIQAGYNVAGHLYERWGERLGLDDGHTLLVANCLAEALRAMGRYTQARKLGEETLARSRRVLGGDHQVTLTSASNLANVLSGLEEFQAARALEEDTLERVRRTLGQDHPETLLIAGNLAATLDQLGEYRLARTLYEDTLARRRRVLGEDHPDTQRSERNLAADLRALGELEPDAD